VRPRQGQQLSRLGNRDAELARQIVGAALPDREAHEEAQHRRRADRHGPHRLLQDLFQLVSAVEREIDDAVAVKRDMDRRARLHRVHEMQLGARQKTAHQHDLGQRGAIEMPDAAGPHRAQDARLRVALDGVKDVARKRPDKASRGRGDRRRPQAKERLRRALARNKRVDARQGKRMPGRTRRGIQRNKTGFRHRTILPEQGGDAGPASVVYRCGIGDRSG
jgi:hypothetical protein